jgi:hypothetical protein
MPSPGLARDWMREQEVAAGPVRTLYAADIGRPRSCEPSCWQPAMRVPAGRPETGASRRSGADADACTEYARLSRHGRSLQSRSRHGRRSMPRHAVLKCAVAVREACCVLFVACCPLRRCPLSVATFSVPCRLSFVVCCSAACSVSPVVCRMLQRWLLRAVRSRQCGEQA